MSDPVWHYGEHYYVKLYYVPDGGSPTWLGWLGTAGVDESYAVPVQGDEDLPPPDTAAQVQWTFDASKGDSTDADSYRKLVASRPRYLTSQGHTGGRVLGGKDHNGRELYWWSSDDIPGNGYPITRSTWDSGRDGDKTWWKVRRDLPTDDPSCFVHTYDNFSELAYYVMKSEVPVLFQFVAAASLRQKTDHEKWITKRWASIAGRPLTQIVIPGSHDAGSYQIADRTDATSRAQQVDVATQLLAGSRFLDLRIDEYQNAWYMFHGDAWTDVQFEHVIQQIDEFLASHTKEFLLIELLVTKDGKGINGMTGDLRKGWQLLFNTLHKYHYNYRDETDPTNADKNADITRLTPEKLSAAGRNLLTFGWGESTYWYFDIDVDSGAWVRDAQKDDPLQPGTKRIFVSPWESKPEKTTQTDKVPDLEGVYVDEPFWTSGPTAKDIEDGYNNYNRMGGQLWNLQTNLPWQFATMFTSIYQHHEEVTPGLVTAIIENRITRDKANIINIDYVGDIVDAGGVGFDLIGNVIKMNDQP